MKKLPIILLLLFITSNAFGATQLKKTVMPSGGDYTSLEACMNANEQDLVAVDKYFDVEIDGSWTSADTTAVVIHLYTTDATRYINIYTTAAARHNGTAYLSGAYRLSYTPTATNFALIDILTNYVTINGLVVILDLSNHKALVAGIGNASGSSKDYATIKNCIVYATNSNASDNYGVGIWIYARTITSYIYNNIVYGFNGAANCSGISVYADGLGTMTSYVYNNTLYNNYKNLSLRGYGTGVVSCYAKNNLNWNGTTDYYSDGANFTFQATSTNNLSKDATAPALNTYYINKTTNPFISTTGGSENLLLSSSATDEIDLGADLHLDTYIPFSTDIIGTTRPSGAAWDIGADEYVSGVTARGQLIMITG